MITSRSKSSALRVSSWTNFQPGQLDQVMRSWPQNTSHGIKENEEIIMYRDWEGLRAGNHVTATVVEFAFKFMWSRLSENQHSMSSERLGREDVHVFSPVFYGLISPQGSWSRSSNRKPAEDHVNNVDIFAKRLVLLPPMSNKKTQTSSLACLHLGWE